MSENNNNIETTATATTETKATKARKGKSLRGVWGKVGAPPKAVNWPNKPFTMAVLFNRNPKQCKLSLRNKVDVEVFLGRIIALKEVKQAGGGVGRPKSRFVLKEYFDPTKMEVSVRPIKTPKKFKGKTVETTEALVVGEDPTTPVVPAVAAEDPTTLVEVPAAPAPEPVVETTTTETAAPTMEAPVAQPVIA